MGIADRDYYRNVRRQSGGFFSQLTPVVKWLLILNLGIYFLDIILAGSAVQKPIRELGAFTIQSGIFEGQIWEFLTFQFMHGSLGHVIFNSLGIFFFGPWMERWWGSVKFTVYYLLCGIAGAVFFSLLTFVGILPRTDLATGLVGASAGIYGILIGVAVIAPNLRVQLLLPPVELSMRQLAIGLILISVGSIALKWGGNEGGEAGHLGGAILGFFLTRFPQLLGNKGADSPGKSKIITSPKLRPRTQIDMEQESQVDLILDKISKDGFQSLTKEEKEILHKAANSSSKK
ncbi:MAG: rhomboid family intramembrane serine protease [Akkermansiaceae bacterium]|nr:rhomboid family intramembrane serine protease [Akkermansiaceae bacterium]